MLRLMPLFCRSVIDEDQTPPNPFTLPPTASVIFEKERQVKLKAGNRGPSKLMRAARQEQDIVRCLFFSVFRLFDKLKVLVRVVLCCAVFSDA